MAASSALRPLVPQMLCPAVKLRFGKAAPQGRDPWPNSGMGRNRHRLQPMSSPYSAVAAVGPVPTIAHALMHLECRLLYGGIKTIKNSEVLPGVSTSPLLSFALHNSIMSNEKSVLPFEGIAAFFGMGESMSRDFRFLNPA